MVEDESDENVGDEGGDMEPAFFSLAELLGLVHVLVHCVDQGDRDELLVATVYVKKYFKPRSSVLTIKRVLES